MRIRRFEFLLQISFENSKMMVMLVEMMVPMASLMRTITMMIYVVYEAAADIGDCGCDVTRYIWSTLLHALCRLTMTTIPVPSPA